MEYTYADITENIIRPGMNFHSVLENAFQEVIYQRALSVEMELRGVIFLKEFEMHVYYKNVQVGLSINFGANSLQWKRPFHNNYNPHKKKA